MSKIDEVLDTLRRQESEPKPRIIPDSDLQFIGQASWGTIPISNILLIAPMEDSEAETFAKQIAGIFDRGGMNVRMIYKQIKRGPSDPDLLFIHNAANSMCVRYLNFSPSFARQLSIKYETVKPPADITDSAAIEKFQSDPKVPLTIVVYPRKTD